MEAPLFIFGAVGMPDSTRTGSDVTTALTPVDTCPGTQGPRRASMCSRNNGLVIACVPDRRLEAIARVSRRARETHLVDGPIEE